MGACFVFFLIRYLILIRSAIVECMRGIFVAIDRRITDEYIGDWF